MYLQLLQIEDFKIIKDKMYLKLGEAKIPYNFIEKQLKRIKTIHIFGSTSQHGIILFEFLELYKNKKIICEVDPISCDFVDAITKERLVSKLIFNFNNIVLSKHRMIKKVYKEAIRNIKLSIKHAGRNNVSYECVVTTLDISAIDDIPEIENDIGFSLTKIKDEVLHNG